MSRRQKLTKSDRKKREAKRVRRAESRNAQIIRYREALRAYIKAVTHEDYRTPRCVCERCGLEQPLPALGEVDPRTGEVTVSVCEGWEYMGCGSEVCYVPEVGIPKEG